MRKITLTQILMLALTLTGLTTMAQTKFLVDFNYNNEAIYQSSPNWNNWNAPIAVDATLPLITDAGVSSALVIKLTSAYGGANASGVATPGSGFAYPGTAMMDALYNSGTTPTTFELSGLDVTKVYNFEFFGSRKDVSNDRTTDYTCAGANTVTASANAAANDHNLALINDVIPNAEGKIIISFVKGSTNAADFAYLNFFTVTEITPVAPQVLLNAENGGVVEVDFFVVDALKIHVMANGPGESVNDYELVDNPLVAGINTSTKVMKYTRRTTGDNAQPWSGFWALIADGYGLPDVTTNKYVHVKVLKTNISPLKFKLEGGAAGTIERGCNDVSFPGSCQTTTGVWEDIVFNFSDRSGTCNVVGFMPDFEDPLTPGADRIIYFDDIVINNSPTPVTAGIQDNYLASRIAMFPNPAQNILYVDTMDELQSVNIFTIEGRQVSVKNNLSVGMNQIDLSNLNAGVYLVKFTATNGASLTQKVIKK